MVQGIDATYSLLRKQQQDRFDEIARQERDNNLTNEILGGLIKGGVAIGNAVLRNKTQDFLETTEQRAATQLATQADTAISRIQHEWDTINSQNKPALQYLTDQFVPFMRERVKAETPDWMEGLDEVSTEYEAKIYEASKQLAQKRLDILTEARDIYEQEGMDDFSGQLEMVRNRYRVTDVADFATQTLAGLFDGKSKPELDMEEILAYRDFIDDQDPTSRAYHGERLIKLLDDFERTGNLSMAKVTSVNRMIAEEKIDPSRGPIITEEEVTPMKVGTSVVLQRRTKTTDFTRKDLQGKPIVTYGEPQFSLMGDDDLTGGGSLISDTDLLSASRQAFDIQQFFQNNLTRDGQDRVIEAMEANVDADGRPSPLSFGDLTTTAKYKKVVDLVFEVVRGNITDETGARVSPNLLKDDEATRIKTAMIQRLIDVDVWAEFGTVFSMDATDPERPEVLRRAMNGLADIIAESSRITGTQPALDRGQP